ncbi:2-amino-4-hydroxy-6-hydroxymethyldihydropteridine diphosphokinase [Ottowia thiooxydans]
MPECDPDAHSRVRPGAGAAEPDPEGERQGLQVPLAGVAPHLKSPVVAYVGLGANLGDAQGSILAAMSSLGRLRQTTVTSLSSLYRTAPMDSSGPDYINAVAEVSTGLTAPDLLRELQRLEWAAGRERPYRNAPRTLDLDLLLYGDARIESSLLTLPHPRLHERAFVLVPLSEIAPTRVGVQALEAVAGQGIERM